ncbi:MAG: chromate transporter [Eubacterium sp.]|nr:chromate transporter [Eubacterium sp.]
MKELLELYTVFFRVGIMMFGGGYAMLPLLRREMVEKKGYVTEEEILEYYAIGQCTPGIIAVNTATFIGYKQKRTVGAVVALLGLVTPAVIIICIVAGILKNFAENPIVEHAFAGIRIAVVALIVKATVDFFRTGVKGAGAFVLFSLTFIASAFFGVSPVIIVLCCGVIGVLYGIYGTKKEAES